MEITEQQVQLLARIRAIPPARRVLVPNRFGRDDVGRVATDILRLRAESANDILLMLPPRGNPTGALALAELLKLPAEAPIIGVLCGITTRATGSAMATLLVLQACTIRVISRHAEIAPCRLEFDHTVSAFMFSGSDIQTAGALTTLEEDLEWITREHGTILEQVAVRIGISRDALETVLTSKPEYSAVEAVATGWGDAVI